MAPRPVLHGTLDATIFQANHLLNSFCRTIQKGLEMVEEVCALRAPRSGLYATIDMGTTTVAETRLRTRQPWNPVWNETFIVFCAYETSFVFITIREELPLSSHVIGRARIPVTNILQGEILDGWYPLHTEDFSNILHKSKVRVRLRFESVEQQPCWGRGIGSRDFQGVEKTFFPQRKGCKVRLYQNSHLSPKYNPEIELGHGETRRLYRPERLWEDVYRYIDGAKHFVYVIGWSVNVKTTLIRDKGAKEVSFGELLKRKGDEGVRVLVLIWEDRTAVEFLKYGGVMETHCNETFDYFKDSNVHCVLCPRTADPSLTFVEKVEADWEFSHHQKSISLDAPFGEEDDCGNSCRTVVSFIGGIDITDGRYDDENHSLFRTLNTVHKHDFLQNNFKDASITRGGPREPWHDNHCMLQGPASYDILTNFTQRWLKQAGKPDLLLRLDQIPGLLGVQESVFEGPKTWNVQIFRSIDDASVVGFPLQWRDAAELGLCTVRNQVVDRSAEKAYIEAIRRAKYFIYIENQYLFGGCQTWDRDQDCGCQHLVPTEIALKIISKIKAREPFAVYILTPMWPEGVPEGETVQSMLYWQRNTLRMMYSMIGQALIQERLDSQYLPTDFLNIFCLGNREIKVEGEYEPPESPAQGTDYWNAQLHRRFPIYIHSKLMIVDDEYLILGSANLNQRSMDGGRDTEIVQGCFQPEEINRGGRGYRARGDVFGYRMSLWYEHFAAKNGCHLSEFMYPERLECVRSVQRISWRISEAYICEETSEDLPGHLLPYPLKVFPDGSFQDDSAFVFPDTTACVQGRRSDILPALLTT